MIELDDRLRALRAHARAWGAELRAIGPDIDRDPEAVHRFLQLDVMRFLATFRRTRDAGTRPLVLGDGRHCHVDTALEQVIFLEQLANGDVGALLAAPGAPMAGPLVEVLGDDAQRAWFFGRMRERPTWAFFALTEPERGSDALNLGTALTPDGDGFVLSGAKRYVGSAARRGVGVVFARTGRGPLGLRAVLVDAAAPGFAADPLPTVGLRGAGLSAIRLDRVPVPAERVLGRHLRATQRGAWGWLRTFNLLRPGLAAMGVGLAQAAYDHLVAERPHPVGADRARFDELRYRIEEVRQLVYAAAVAVDDDPDDGVLASAAKSRAARLAETATLAAVELLGPGARLEHPRLDQLARDARGLEFMEGTGHVQRLLVSQHVIRGVWNHDRPAGARGR